MKWIFDKEGWIAEMKKRKKISKETIEAFYHVGDVIEELISVISDHIEELENLKELMREHKHLNGKAVREIT